MSDQTAAVSCGFWRAWVWVVWLESYTRLEREVRRAKSFVARAEQGREYVRTRAREAREQASGWVDKGRDVVNQQKDQFRAAYEAGRQAYQEATTETAPTKGL